MTDLSSLGDLIPIPHFKDAEEALGALNSHFKTATLEKHYKAVLSFSEGEATRKVLKHVHGRISKRAENRIRDSVIKQLRDHYGCWINIYDWGKEGYFTNFDCTYKTQYGRLYGHKPRTVFDHVFYTTHCFEQFDARTEGYPFGLLELAFKNIRNTSPTKADILRFLTTMTSDEFCDTPESLYVNTGMGIVVFDKLYPGMLIAKTFLLPDMTYPQKGWYESSIGGFTLDRTTMGMEFRKKREKVFPLVEPTFHDPCDLSYAELAALMKIRGEFVLAFPYL